MLYIFLRSGMEERFEDVSEDVTVEYDSKDRPIGIEIYNASKILPSEKLARENTGLTSRQISTLGPQPRIAG